jgi:hypothetical protein
MSRAEGNTLRPSSVAPGQTVLGNLPPGYPTEEWLAYHWSVNPRGELISQKAALHLPHGYSAACCEVEIGGAGCIDRVRRWGVACRMAPLEEMGFDATFLIEQEGWNPEDDSRVLHWYMQATHFDLPGDFIIASDEHPFLLFAPNGMLAGSYIHWYTQLGASAYYASGGRVAGDFSCLWRDDRALYSEALGYALEALGG